jgi:hypothetical protein
MTTANGTRLWLEEGIVHAGKMLQDLIKVEKSRNLSPAEQKIKTVSATYCYLYTKLKELDLLIDSEDTIFPDETIH